MGKKVPHCKECERCQCIDIAFKSYYCCEENEPYKVFMRLGVNSQPTRSPKWCPKRKIEKEEEKQNGNL